MFGNVVCLTSAECLGLNNDHFILGEVFLFCDDSRIQVEGAVLSLVIYKQPIGFIFSCPGPL